MKKLFSAKLYLQGIKKSRGAGIATAIIIIVANALIPIIALISELTRKYDYSYQNVERTVRAVPYNDLAPFAALVIALAPLITFSMFSYLNERSKSDFYHSLPQRRECIFNSLLLADLTWSLGTVFVSVVLNSVLWSLVPYCSVSILTVLVCLATFFVLALFITAIMVLSMSVTGTAVANFLMGIVFLLFFRVIGAMFVEGVDTVSRVFLLDYSPLKWLGFEFFLFFLELIQEL